MKPNFHSNQILYVRGIGYARLGIDRDKNNKPIQPIKQLENTSSQVAQESAQEGNDSLLFDPEMFNIDADSPFSDSQEINLSEHNTRKKSMEIIRRASSDIKNRELIIVPLKLQQTNAMIYCPDSYLMKKIQVDVKSLLQNNRKRIQIGIEITKTVDTLKNQIFKDLEQEIGHYSDIKIFTSTPRLEQLSSGSKTIWQYYLKDKCKLTISGKFNFTFKPLLGSKSSSYGLSNGNNTIAFLKKEQLPIIIKKQDSTVKKQQPIIVNNEPPKLQSDTIVIENKKSSPDENKEVLALCEKIVQIEEPKRQTDASKEIEKISKKQVQIQKLHLQCNVKLRSGLHYWQIKIEKLNMNIKNEQNVLQIGVCLKSQQQSSTQHYEQLWAYDLLRSKKIKISNPNIKQISEQQNASDSSDEEYGSVAKSGDIIGVILSIKEKTATLVFYRNSICLKECYEINVQMLKKKQYKHTKYLCPFINLRGLIQINLDSKANPPLDSYRFK